MAKKSKNGFFISFEGPECAGKTTQINLLKKCFEERFGEILATREPGGTELGEQLRNIVKHHVHGTVCDEAELLMIAASRAQHVSLLIKPALQRGCMVITDRFLDSTTAYQGHARGLDMDFIRKLNDFAVAGCMPDLTILLDLPAEESLRRASRREETLFVEDRFESEKIDFHRNVREGFLCIAKDNPDRVKVLSALDNMEVIHSHIIALVDEALR